MLKDWFNLKFVFICYLIRRLWDVYFWSLCSRWSDQLLIFLGCSLWSSRTEVVYFCICRRLLWKPGLDCIAPNFPDLTAFCTDLLIKISQSERRNWVRLGYKRPADFGFHLVLCGELTCSLGSWFTGSLGGGCPLVGPRGRSIVFIGLWSAIASCGYSAGITTESGRRGKVLKAVLLEARKTLVWVKKRSTERLHCAK